MRRIDRRAHCAGRSLIRVKRSRCFTLLELLLATVILLIVLASASLAFRSVILSWRNMARNTGRVEQRLKMTGFADDYLRNVIAFKYTHPDSNINQIMFSGGETELWGCARRRVDSSVNSGLTFFRLFCEDGKLYLQSAGSPFFPDMDTAMTLNSELLSEDVDTLSFSYAHYLNGGLEWENKWDPEDYIGKLPQAVLISVEWTGGEKEVWLRRLNGAQEFFSFPFQEAGDGR